MSNQVYSNLSERVLYRSSEELDSETMEDNQIVTQSIGVIAVGPFRALSPPNPNYEYIPATKTLLFHTEGVYSISLTTAWSLTVADGRLMQYITKNNDLDRFGITAIGGVVGPINVGPALSSNVVLKLKVDDFVSFWCSGNNSGVQTIIGSLGIIKSAYFVSKIS